MTPKQKAIVFLLLATVVNLVMTIVYFIIFLLLTLHFLRDALETYGSWLVILPLIISIIASFFSYWALIKWLDRKWHIQQHLRQK